MSGPENRGGRFGRKKKTIAAFGALLAGVLLVMLIVIVGRRHERPAPGQMAPVPAVRESAGRGEAAPRETVVPAQAETTDVPAPVPAKKNRQKVPARSVPAPVRSAAPADTTVRKDTARATAETTAAAPDAAPKAMGPECATDTAALWVYPEPSGGLHHGKLSVRLRANRPCTITWRFSADSAEQVYRDDPVAVERNAELVFSAVDKCGNAAAERREIYVIGPPPVPGRCQPDMEAVEIGSTRFCIDRYEWPDRNGSMPASYVSYAGASDSCASRKKRLCTSEEWALACSGPYSWPYPYGPAYEPHACVTSDTTVRPSGSRPECRAWFGLFDMSGNLAEWTSTPARENRNYYNVMGGFWESGPRSGCLDIRYSYFPQNRHNPVGFRCCTDIQQ